MNCINFYQNILLFILLVTSFFSCDRNPANKSNPTNKNSDSTQIYLQKGNSAYKKRDYDSAFYYDQKLYQYAVKTNNIKSQGASLFNMGFYFQKVEKNPDSAFFYYNASVNYNRKINDSSEVGSILLNMAIIQKNRNDYFGAKETLTEALKHLENSEDKKYRASVYDQLGTSYQKLYNYPDAIQYHKKAIETTESGIDKIIYKNNLATTFIEKDEFKKAINILGIIIHDSLKNKWPKDYARLLHNLEYAKWKHNNSEHIENFLEALQIRNDIDDVRGQIASHTNLAEYFLEEKPLLAKKHIDSLIQLAKNAKNLRAELDALKLLMKLEPENVGIRDRHISLNDSLYKKELKVKTQFAKLRYDDELKSEEIQKLELETLKQNAEIKEQYWQKVIFIILSLFILMASVGMYFLIRERNKKQQLQTVYATERRLSKKIHDELANEVYGVMNNLQFNPSEQNEKLLDKLDFIYNKTRDISKSYNQEISDLNFEQQLKDLLNAYHGNGTSILVKGLNKDLFVSFPKHKKEAVFLVVQEIMVNMKKYSEANLVALTFSHANKYLVINYKDNGVGVDLKTKERNGLLNMETRIHDIKGTFNFVSEPGNGVKINISIPFK
jgi:signal transduction histidine kinase/tetratricopeptide (TPR) repeat protein